jgi:hypothetical protein
MELERGKMYKFTEKATDKVVVVRIVAVNQANYDTLVLQNDFVPEMVGQRRLLFKGHSKMFTDNYKIDRILTHDEKEEHDNVEIKSSGIVKRRRSKDEIEVDSLLEHVLLKGEINRLYIKINKALDDNNQDEFVRLTKEYAKLKKKVTA